MPHTEAEANRVMPSIYSDHYTILPKASLSLASTIPSLALSPLLVSNSFTSSLHLLCGFLLPFLPSTFAWYTSSLLISHIIPNKDVTVMHVMYYG